MSIGYNSRIGLRRKIMGFELIIDYNSKEKRWVLDIIVELDYEEKLWGLSK